MAISIPGLFLLLFFAVIFELFGGWLGRFRWIPWKPRRGENSSSGLGGGKRMAAALGTEEMFAFLYQTKRNELRQRDVELVMSQEEDDGAPPRSRIDLERGTAYLKLPPSK
ncbi:DUF6191 domain-containing protein [Amycolatopsis anabasis]|uniref:DUF6191 domain-containing protein n=1 Tax=Amycolatopsis anabasis TaxID=1840409 RepID=UPI00131ED02E|nr:DUF6191 domain-containing protein [Amycolatopsis anabasis]